MQRGPTNVECTQLCHINHVQKQQVHASPMKTPSEAAVFVVEKGISRTDKNDSNFSRLYYVRYADDFLFGYVGPKKTANEIYTIAEKFLKNKLFFNCNKSRTGVSHGSQHIK